MDEQRTPERPEHEQPTGAQQPAGQQPTQPLPAAQPTQPLPVSQPTQPLPPVPGPPQAYPRPAYVPPAYGQAGAHPYGAQGHAPQGQPGYGQPTHPSGAHPQAGHPQAGHPQAGHPQGMPTPWPPAAPYGGQQQYGAHQYGPHVAGQPGAYPGHPGYGTPGQAGHGAQQRRGVSAGVVAGVTAGALAFGLIAGGGGVALYEYLDGQSQSPQSSALDQGQGAPSDGSGSDGSGSDGSGSDGTSPFSGGGSGGDSTSPWGQQGLPGGGSDQGDQNGTSQGTTEPTSAQTKGVVLIDSVLGYQGAESAGTGMVLTSDGLVLTNNHVVQGATSISVTIGATGKTYQAEVVGTDKSKDVALLQLKDASGLTTVKLDDDQGVTRGDDVTAVGNAQGGGSLVAAPGSVTATDQSMTASTESSDGSETLNGLIEFSAGVVSGDSGGPLLDSEGEVVGMTTAASSGGTSTVAYAIDITDAIAVAHKIDQGQAGNGIVIGTPAFLGVAFTAGSTGGSGGATVGQVLQGTPAARAGITAGDAITKVGSKAVSSADALSKALGKYAPGDKVKITWVSGTSGKTQSATVTLMAGPAA
ncbi:S1C family serine protease [Cellulomonas alba]|uniref:Trypsin-like peptidase domain-containing protein n=1 Tax=Cellulomonas alba TaxID=3053467 RepID=A0ABT7SKG7_9CELL|nr:trypsin-like peptidase domain-containing protein [Cellulomonas alba]MDM7856651.1 trypsin-like peptidase domain-containing protein [Cellulomonas alba]